MYIEFSVKLDAIKLTMIDERHIPLYMQQSINIIYNVKLLKNTYPDSLT